MKRWYSSFPRLFLLSSPHNLMLCVMSWKRTVLPIGQCQYVISYVKGGADLFLYGCFESEPLTHFHPCVLLRTLALAPGGTLSCQCGLDPNTLISSETTGIFGKCPHASNETFGKNKGEMYTLKIQTFCITQIIIAQLSWWFLLLFPPPPLGCAVLVINGEYVNLLVCRMVFPGWHCGVWGVSHPWHILAVSPPSEFHLCAETQVWSFSNRRHGPGKVCLLPRPLLIFLLLFKWC